jgi:hypothetical protein
MLHLYLSVLYLKLNPDTFAWLVTIKWILFDSLALISQVLTDTHPKLWPFSSFSSSVVPIFAFLDIDCVLPFHGTFSSVPYLSKFYHLFILHTRHRFFEEPSQIVPLE